MSPVKNSVGGAAHSAAPHRQVGDDEKISRYEAFVRWPSQEERSVNPSVALWSPDRPTDKHCSHPRGPTRPLGTRVCPRRAQWESPPLELSEKAERLSLSVLLPDALPCVELPFCRIAAHCVPLQPEEAAGRTLREAERVACVQRRAAALRTTLRSAACRMHAPCCVSAADNTRRRPRAAHVPARRLQLAAAQLAQQPQQQSRRRPIPSLWA
jgi:hypothetical protein